MKLIDKKSSTIHGYWNNSTTNYYYYLCDTDEEYQSYVDKLQNESSFSVTPSVDVSDGYAISGGQSFNAIGVCEFKKTNCMHVNEVNYYIKPNSITDKKDEPIKGWYV